MKNDTFDDDERAAREKIAEQWRPSADRLWNLRGDEGKEMRKGSLDFSADAARELVEQHHVKGLEKVLVEIKLRAEDGGTSLTIGDDFTADPESLTYHLRDRGFKVTRHKGAGMGMTIDWDYEMPEKKVSKTDYETLSKTEEDDDCSRPGHHRDDCHCKDCHGGAYR